MKSLPVLLLVALGVVSCATSPQASHYKEVADANTFAYFFDGQAEVKVFSNLDDAKDFVGGGRVKLETSINKHSVQGLAARLAGDPYTSSQPVVVVHYLSASSDSGRVDLLGPHNGLQNKLREAVSVASVFLVFYGDRQVSISDFYLDSRYHYNSNSQYRKFDFKGNVYTTDYPIGWGAEQAFQYLNKDIE